MSSRFPIYQALMKLYPKAYREKYGQPMVEMLDDVIGERPSRWQRTKVELRACLDLPRHITSQNVLALEHDWTYNTPPVTRLASLTALLLLTPFLVNFVVNFLSEAYSFPLEHSWLWSKPVLITWGLALPTIAFLVAMFGLLRLAIRKELRLRQSWPAILAGCVALGVIFVILAHFSGSCFTNTSQNTLQCVSQGLNGDKDGQG